MLAELVGEMGKVFAFEPQRLVFQTLAGNMAINSLTNVHCYQKAVGATTGSLVVPVLDYNQYLTLYDAAASNAIVTSTKKYFVNFGLIEEVLLQV